MTGDIYIAPPQHTESVFSDTILQQYTHQLPPCKDAGHILSPGERAFYQSEHSRWQLLYLLSRNFQGSPDISQIRKKIIDWNASMHVALLVLASAFTNSLWSLDNSLQVDKEKFWSAVTNHGTRGFGTVHALFNTVPLSAVTLDFLLLLPIAAIIGYLAHHQARIKQLPWFNDDSWSILTFTQHLRSLHNLDPRTRVPYKHWILYLVDLVHHLNASMYIAEDAYQIVRETFQATPTRLTAYDAGVFVRAHFPLEHSRLGTEQACLALLGRAVDFAWADKFSRDIFTNCSQKWAVCVYYLFKGRFPPNGGNDYRPNYDMIECRRGLLDLDSGRCQKIFQFERILHGPAKHLPHFLQEHPLAKTLYGQTVLTVSTGVQRLMVSGCLLYFYMLLHGKRYVDKRIPTAFLVHILSHLGVLAPTEVTAPRFASKVIPVHQLQTATITVEAIIRSAIPIAMVLPMAHIKHGMNSSGYREHYNSTIQAVQCSANTIIDKSIQEFHRRVTPDMDYTTDPCLFPVYNPFSVEDYSTEPSTYPALEGARMVQKAQAALQPIEKETNRCGDELTSSFSNEASGNSVTKHGGSSDTSTNCAVRNSITRKLSTYNNFNCSVEAKQSGSTRTTGPKPTITSM